MDLIGVSEDEDSEKQSRYIVRAEVHFRKEVRSVINRFRNEYDVTYEQLIGCLEMIKGDLYDEAASLEMADDGDEGLSSNK